MSTIARILNRSFASSVCMLQRRCMSKVAVEYDNTKKEISLNLDNSEVTRFPYEFLRDNCQCNLCFHETSCQSLTLLPDVLRDSDEGLQDAVYEDGCLKIKWNSGHDSDFSKSWLQERAFSQQRTYQKGKHPVIGLQHILWGAEKKDSIQAYDFQDILRDERKLLRWMTTMATEGISLLKNTPREPGQLQVLAQRGFGGLFNTMYGETFTVKEKPSANNIAYTSGYLALHTDQPYYIYQPGMQFLHCINGSVKNEAVNLLVDGFKVAADLRKEEPESFDVLTKLAFPYEQHGTDVFGDFTLAADKTTIGLNEEGEVTRVSHNYPSRAQYLNQPSQEARKLYRAVGELHKRFYDPKYMFEYQLQDGDILGFQNTRVLHGRTAYDPSRSNRWLEGGYGNLDDLHARLRALRNKFANES